ncbi:hypothetical protein PM3016_6695 [Paenibacillus mucilaginosus 3016]|uniref:GIY-YIG domain-containing protein n=1 Tax=Paenibacillus mucilaginosus 3016 TaxID=1116391 RepID=H6NNI2_9BACL|nr:GIY-YIG nuclease family protein [Paenibacillus mucilaginosus]AFC33303.1 hypothetical protein PM3016_6695 [Paenibacillus mucilaginosus 3016]WFA21720.1 hypothetical protein ERY13_33240 [Paenibacillus mucilaginosus]
MMDFLETGLRKIKFKVEDVFVCPDLYHGCDIVDFSKLKWKEVKFLSEPGVLHTDMDKLPRKGGIYIFCAKHHLLPSLSGQIMYIGRAHFSRQQNLKKRCREYLTENKRPKVIKMREFWGENLHIYYTELENNDVIDEVEKRLIESIHPPFCSEIKDVTLRKSKKAFG